MEDEQAADHGEYGAAPEPESGPGDERRPEADAQREPDLDEVEPELLATFTEIGIVETRRAIEAILLVATDPTPASLLAQLLEVQVEHVELLCHALADRYEEANHGFQLVKVAGGWRFQTHPDMAPYVERFAMDGQSSKLSNAALETLAIVAYKQPISRAQVSAIRGVNVDAVLRTLVQRGYVDEVGRDTGAGQAVLFGTTSMFLERLGINTVSDLPALGDFVPSAEVVEALEQTLKVDLDPDLVTIDRDGDDGPARPPTSSGTTGADGAVDASDGEAPESAGPFHAAEPGPGPDVTDVMEGSLDFRRDIDGPADNVAVASEPAHGEAATMETDGGEPVSVGAGDEGAPEPAQPASQRVAEQAGQPLSALFEPVAAPEGVVVDAEASPKSGADGADLPLGPGGQPPGRQTGGGGQPGVAEPAAAPLAGPEVGGADGADGPALGPGRGSGSGSDRFVVSHHRGDATGPGADPDRPGPAAGRPDHEVPVGHEPGSGNDVEGHRRAQDLSAPAPTPTPAGGDEPSPQPDPAPVGDGRSAVTGRGVDGPSGEPWRQPSADRVERGGPGPAVGHRGATQQSGDAGVPGPGGPGLAGSADPAVPPTAGPEPDVTGAEPDVDLRAPGDLTDPPAPAPAPAIRIGPDVDRT